MLLRTSFVVATLTISTIASAVDLPHTFVAGERASASDVNENFQALASAANEVTATSFGAEYILDASTSGALGSRNVIVLKQDKGGSGVCNEEVYRFRLFYDNTENETVNTPSGAVAPERIWIGGQVCASRNNPTVADQYRESRYALPSTNNDPNRGFSQALGLEQNVDFDGDGFFDSSEVLGYRETRASNPLAQSELIHSVLIYSNSNDEIVRTVNWSSITSVYEGPLTIGAPLTQTFNDVMMQTFFTNSLTRLRARNVGMVLESRPSDNSVGQGEPAKAIYYRMNGQPVGSLANTPFSGGVVAGRWFTE